MVQFFASTNKHITFHLMSTRKLYGLYSECLFKGAKRKVFVEHFITMTDMFKTMFKTNGNLFKLHNFYASINKYT